MWHRFDPALVKHLLPLVGESYAIKAGVVLDRCQKANLEALQKPNSELQPWMLDYNDCWQYNYFGKRINLLAVFAEMEEHDLIRVVVERGGYAVWLNNYGEDLIRKAYCV